MPSNVCCVSSSLPLVAILLAIAGEIELSFFIGISPNRGCWMWMSEVELGDVLLLELTTVNDGAKGLDADLPRIFRLLQ